MSPDQILRALEGAPWWVQLIVIVIVAIGPVALTRLWPDRTPLRAPTTATSRPEPLLAQSTEPESAADADALQSHLLWLLGQLQEAQAQATELSRTLIERDETHRRERAEWDQALRLEQTQAAALAEKVRSLELMVQALLERRTMGMPPAP